MIQAMYNGVSGLRAHKTMMDVISNNIANVNTVGYKSSRVSFREAFSQTMKGASAPSTGAGGTNPQQLGLGVAIGSIDVNQNQGSLQPTGNLTDLAVEGSGYFILTDGSSEYFTRDGGFTVDKEGNFVSSATGYKVKGWSDIDPLTGRIKPLDTGSEVITVPVDNLARQTSQIIYGGNLNSSTAPGESSDVSALIYDSEGNPHTISLSFTKMQVPMNSQGYAADTTLVGTGNVVITVGEGTDDEATYTVASLGTDTLSTLATKITAAGGGGKLTATVVDSGVAGADRYHIAVSSVNGRQIETDTSGLVGGTAPTFTEDAAQVNKWSWAATENSIAAGTGGTISFDTAGKYDSSTGSISLAVTGGPVSPLVINPTFASITQLYGASSPRATSQDGLPMGTLDTVTISNDGTISGVFTNGMTYPLARLALATFSNPAGLSKVGNNMLIESSNSGPCQYNGPAEGSTGKVVGGFLESSNVDLPTEFANMIVAQRGFQANARIITTSDEILQELVQLKR